jgi:xanthine dehydrogenase iron-sulfur cluster and FAD-binding subunit A
MAARTSLQFTVNGKQYTLDSVDVSMTMLEWLRSVGLTGTKLGCGEGGCGACTINVQSYDATAKVAKDFSINACLMPLMAADSCVITTVEGIGNAKDGLHPIQQRMVDFHGSQCGYCTPGIVMAMYSTFKSHPDTSVKDIEEHMDGNLCRCTGYRPIWDAAKSLCGDAHECAHAMNSDKVDIEDISRCHMHEGEPADVGTGELTVTTTAGRMLSKAPLKASGGGNADVITAPFPAAYVATSVDALQISGGRVDGGADDVVTWHRPNSLLSLLSIKVIYTRTHIRSSAFPLPIFVSVFRLFYFHQT